MPRLTHKFSKPKPKPDSLSAYEQLRNLKLAVQTRAEQVKLRRLEWDTQTLALPHITPMPGDGVLQIRKPLSEEDMPRPRPPKEMPELQPGMPYEVYQILLDLYLNQMQQKERRDPYNKLASVTAQAVLEAAQAREDARLEKQKDREKRERDRKAKAAAKPAS